MCSLLLVCAGLKTLHLVKHILNEVECRSVGKAGVWWNDELAVTIAVKPPSVVQKTLVVLEEKGEFWGDLTAMGIKSKLCTTWQLVLMLVA